MTKACPILEMCRPFLFQKPRSAGSCPALNMELEREGSDVPVQRHSQMGGVDPTRRETASDTDSDMM